MLDLTMGRMAQIREVIWERRKQDEERDLKVREVELRTLSSFIAAAGGHEEGLAAARKVSLLPEDADAKPAKKELRPIPTHMIGRLFS